MVFYLHSVPLRCGLNTHTPLKIGSKNDILSPQPNIKHPLSEGVLCREKEQIECLFNFNFVDFLTFHNHQGQQAS